MTNWFPKMKLKVPILRVRSRRDADWPTTGYAKIRKNRIVETAEERYKLGTPVEASEPEKMVYAWLVRNQFDFEYQVSVIGGRAPGGAVLDFVVYATAIPLVIRVQSYWHAMAAQAANDDIQLAKLQEMGYNVVDVWESDLGTVESTEDIMMRTIYGAH